MTDENSLEQLAKQGRDAKRRRDDEIARHLSSLQLDRSGDALLGEALGGGFGWPVWVAFFVGVPAVFIAIGLAADLEGAGVHVAWGLTLAVGALLLQRIGDSVRRAEQLRWLADYPYGFDRTHYANLLRRKWEQQPIRVSIDFSRRVPPEARPTVEEALIGTVEREHWMGDGQRSTARWTGDRLTIQSGAMHGHFGTVDATASRPAHHSNRQFHRWFRLLTDEGLSVLHRQYPIANVQVSIGRGPP